MARASSNKEETTLSSHPVGSLTELSQERLPSVAREWSIGQGFSDPVISNEMLPGTTYMDPFLELLSSPATASSSMLAGRNLSNGNPFETVMSTFGTQSTSVRDYEAAAALSGNPEHRETLSPDAASRMDFTLRPQSEPQSTGSMSLRQELEAVKDGFGLPITRDASRNPSPDFEQDTRQTQACPGSTESARTSGLEPDIPGVLTAEEVIFLFDKYAQQARR